MEKTHEAIEIKSQLDEPSLIERTSVNLIAKDIDDKSSIISDKSKELEALEREMLSLPETKTGRTLEEKAKIRKDRLDKNREIKLKRQEIDILKTDPITVDNAKKDLLTGLQLRPGDDIPSEIKSVDDVKRLGTNLIARSKERVKPYAKVVSVGIVKLSEIFDNIPQTKGVHDAYKRDYDAITNAVEDVLVEMQHDKIDITKYLNPYTSLGIVLATPILASVLVNTGHGVQTPVNSAQMSAPNTNSPQVVKIGEVQKKQ